MPPIKKHGQGSRDRFRRPPRCFPVPVADVFAALEPLYGPVEWKPRYDALNELIFTVLTQHTSDLNAERAFDSLRTQFPEWALVARADPEQIAAVIRHGGLANQKSVRIKQILIEVRDRVGQFDLDFLKSMQLEEARSWLTSLPGVGPKTAAVVMAFALGMPAMPVDTHVHRVSTRLGLIRKGTTADEAHPVLESITDPEKRFTLHVLLITHGRRTCKARNPVCMDCPLAGVCPSRGQFAPV